MASLQWVLDLLLAGLLGATLFHAMRLERALGVLKNDRGALDEMLGSFGTSTREAEAGIERLRGLTDSAALQIVRQAELGTALKDDLAFLIERGDRLADRMDTLIRTARPIAADPPRQTFIEPPEPEPEFPRPAAMLPYPDRVAAPRPPEPRVPAARPAEAATTEGSRMRSQAERDLLNALRMTK